MAKERICALHGRHERRKCPACEWCRQYPLQVRHESGCPMCGEPLDDSNGFLMTCTNDLCLMQTTSHPPLRRKANPADVGLRGSRL